MSPDEYGLFYLLINLHTWIFIISDGMGLQSIIQFGMNEDNQPKVNMLALILQISISISLALIVFFLRYPLSGLFTEPRFVHVGEWLPVFILLTLPRTYTIKLVVRDREYRNLFLIDLAFFGTMSLVTFYMIYSLKEIQFHNMINMYLCGMTCSSLLGILLARKKLRFSIKGAIKLREIMKFTIPYGAYAMLHSVPRTLDIYIVQYFFPTSSTGIYQSAKTLYRFFEEILNTSYSLVYSPAVNLYERKDMKGLHDLMTKSTSFIFLTFTAMVLFFECGASQWLITTFLPVKWHLAVGQFNLMIIGAVAMSFMMLSVIITAVGRPKIVLLFVSISAILSVSTYFIVGVLGESSLIALGIIVYNFSFGLLSFFYVSKNLGYEIKQLFRAIGDSRNFIKKVLLKKSV